MTLPPLDWEHFVTPEEVKEAARASEALNRSLDVLRSTRADIDREIMTLECFARMVDKRMGRAMVNVETKAISVSQAPLQIEGQKD